MDKGNIDVYDNKEGQSNDYLCDSLPLCKGSETIQSEDLPRENSARLDLDSRACEVGLKTGSRRLIERRKDIGKEKKCDENNDFVEPEVGFPIAASFTGFSSIYWYFAGYRMTWHSFDVTVS